MDELMVKPILTILNVCAMRGKVWKTIILAIVWSYPIGLSKDRDT